MQCSFCDAVHGPQTLLPTNRPAERPTMGSHRNRRKTTFSAGDHHTAAKLEPYRVTIGGKSIPVEARNSVHAKQLAEAEASQKIKRLHVGQRLPVATHVTRVTEGTDR